MQDVRVPHGYGVRVRARGCRVGAQGRAGVSRRYRARLYAEYCIVIFAVLDAVTLSLGCLLMRRVVLPWLEAGLDDAR